VPLSLIFPPPIPMTGKPAKRIEQTPAPLSSIPMTWALSLSAFKTLEMRDPKDFYDAIITAGFPLRKGSSGTLGELSPKPHPWLYAEVSRVGLGISERESAHVIGIEDSGAGVCSIRLAGFPVIGIGGGNIKESGTLGLCDHFCNDFEEIMNIVRG